MAAYSPEITLARRGRYGYMAQIVDGSSTSVCVDGMDEEAVAELALHIRRLLIARRSRPDTQRNIQAPRPTATARD
jgi:hypothetical protein